jgi:hypothetical protein
MAWVHDLKIDFDQEVIAIDGKTIRGSLDKHGGIRVAHIVSAWASENRMI